MKKLTALLTAALAFVMVTGSSFADDMKEIEKSSTPRVSSVYSENDLLNLTVFNREGEEIGKIRDVSKNPETGEINFVTLAEGGFLGFGEKEYTLPLEVLNINRDEGRANLLVTEDKLASAPSREEGMSDAEFEELINKHYGIAPTWERDTTVPERMMPEEEKSEGERDYNY